MMKFSLFTSPPWRDRTGAFSIVRACALALAVLPALYHIARFLIQGFGARPLTEAIHVTGDWAIRLLLATMIVTPLMLILKSPRLVATRRILGVAVFAWAFAHFLLFIPDKSFNLGVVLTEIVSRVYLAIGMIVLLLFAAQAATSTDAMVARMGAVAWKRLHNFVYLATGLGLVHFFMQSKADISEPTLMLGLFALVFALRVPRRFGRTLTPLMIAGIGVAVALLTAFGEAGWFAWRNGIDFDAVLQANFDFEFGVRPAWWPLGAATIFAALALVAPWLKAAPRAVPARAPVRDAVQR